MQVVLMEDFEIRTKSHIIYSAKRKNNDFSSLLERQRTVPPEGLHTSGETP